MNIFRPAYFTLRHWREGGGVISLSGQTAEWKESIRCGRTEKMREIEGIQLCLALTEFHKRQMRREVKKKKPTY